MSFEKTELTKGSIAMANKTSSRKTAPSRSAVAPAKSAPPEASGGRQKRLSRQELAPSARRAIFEAAAKVVGEYGYADASIAHITEAAGIAQGTFYLYFSSRQELLDELLPHVGQDMVRFLRDRVAGAKDVYDAEERGFRAFFDFLKEYPGFFRVLNEAEGAAPVAHQKHFKVMSDHYVESLKRGVKGGQIRRFRTDELEAVAYIFMAARSYLYMRYVKNESGGGSAPEEVVQAYMKIVRGGLT
jgi:AcrR family transcriptional regulator